MRRAIPVGLLCFFVATTAFALGYKVSVDAPAAWANDTRSIAVVVTEGDPALNLEDLRKQIADQLVDQGRKLPFSVESDGEVAAVVGWDWSGKDPEAQRSAVFEKTKADALLEVQVPFARGPRFNQSGAEVRVRLRLILKTGETRMSGDCSAQAFNALSSPENIARHCALRIVGKALGKNLD